jgi:putative hemolysin
MDTLKSYWNNEYVRLAIKRTAIGLSVITAVIAGFTLVGILLIALWGPASVMYALFAVLGLYSVWAFIISYAEHLESMANEKKRREQYRVNTHNRWHNAMPNPDCTYCANRGVQTS